RALALEDLELHLAAVELEVLVEQLDPGLQHVHGVVAVESVAGGALRPLPEEERDGLVGHTVGCRTAVAAVPGPSAGPRVDRPGHLLDPGSALHAAHGDPLADHAPARRRGGG